MIRRSTWIIIAVFALSLGALWYLEWSPAKEARMTPTPTTMPRLLESIDINKIVQIEVIRTKGDNLVLKKNPDRTWSFGDRPGILVDQGQAELLTSSLFSLNIKSSLGDNIAMSAIGLDTATSTIKLVTSSGSPNYLHIGKINPINNGYYVRFNDLKPVLVDNYALDEIISLLSFNQLIMATPTPFPTPVPQTTVTPTPQTP